jgi:hypothetical protein
MLATVVGRECATPEPSDVTEGSPISMAILRDERGAVTVVRDGLRRHSVLAASVAIAWAATAPSQGAPSATVAHGQTFLSQTFEIVGSYGGSPGAVAVAGRLVYAAVGYTVASLDFPEGAEPRSLGEIGFTAQVSCLLHEEGRLLVGAGQDLVVLDVSDPAAMRETARYPLRAECRDLMIEGSDVLVASAVGIDTLSGWPDGSLQIGAGYSGGAVQRIALVGTRLVAASESDLRLLERSTSDGLMETARLELGGFVLSLVAFEENQLYAAVEQGEGPGSESSSIAAIDVALNRLTLVNITHDERAQHLVRVNGLLLGAHWPRGVPGRNWTVVTSWRLGNSGSLERVGEAHVTGGVRSVVPVGSELVFGLAGAPDPAILRSGLPEENVYIGDLRDQGRFSVDGGFGEIAAGDGLLAGVSQSGRLWTLAPAPGGATALAHQSASDLFGGIGRSLCGGRCELIVRGGQVLISSGNNGLLLVDATNPNEPALTGTLSLEAEPEGFDIVGALGLVAVPRVGAVQAFTLDGASLRSTGRANGPEAVRDVAILHPRRYATASRAGVDLFEIDVGDAFGARPLAHYPFDDAMFVAAGSDGHVYVAGGTGAIRILSASDLSELGRVDADGESRVVDFLVEGDAAYVILTSHVRAINIEAPSEPFEIARLVLDRDNWARAGAMLDGHLYVATADGLFVVRLTDAKVTLAKAYLPMLRVGPRQ